MKTLLACALSLALVTSIALAVRWLPSNPLPRPPDGISGEAHVGGSAEIDTENDARHLHQWGQQVCDCGASKCTAGATTLRLHQGTVPHQILRAGAKFGDRA